MPAVACATAEALLARPSSERVVVFGHSTGAQAALRAALLVQDVRPLAAVVLAGPTVAPTQRRLDLLALAAAGAYRHDSPRELVALPEVLRARLRLLSMVRSAMADPRAARGGPDGTVAADSRPVRHLRPSWWLDLLASGATRSPAVTVARLPGSHNNPFTHPEDIARGVTSSSGASS